MIKKIYSLVFIRDFENKKILLGYKKRGFGKDKWNGLGGKVEPNETIVESAIRETKEESGLDAIELHRVGLLEFQFDNKMDEILQANVFNVTKYNGEPVETEEMLPKWFDYNDIPYNQMWSDDIHWLPLLLENKLFKGYFLFKADEKTILQHEINEVISLD